MMKLLLLSNILFISLLTNAQWDSVTRFNQPIKDLQVFNGKLFMAGSFSKNEANFCWYSANYDGTTISRHTTGIGGQGIRGMADFNGTLFCVDALDYGAGEGVGTWSGTTWQSALTGFNPHSVIYADGTDLYVVGDDRKVRKKTGTGPFSVFLDMGATTTVTSIVRYGSKLIFAGTFTMINGVAADGIAAWDGTNFSKLGLGITGVPNCMEVYNNELYVAGKLTSAGSLTVNSIAKWDGTNWFAVGGGITGLSTNGIRDMKASTGGLIVVGDFNQMGGVTTSNVAVWKGSTWTGLGLVHGDSYVNCVDVFNGKIYIGTSDPAHSHLYRYNGNVGIASVTKTDVDFSIYPNPANDMINIQSSDIIGGSISICDLNGRELISDRLGPGTRTIDISNLGAGIYFMRVRNGNDESVKKFTRL